MASSDERVFVPVNIAILTVSDTRTLETDKSGRTLQELAEADGHTIVAREIVEDSAEAIAARLRAWIAEPEVDVVLSTGGTGLTGRDVTPEAFKAVMEKEIEGFGELFRWLSYQTIGTSTMQSRAIGGLADGTSSPCPAPPAPAATAGARSSAPSSTTEASPATWSSSCPGSWSGSGLRPHSSVDPSGQPSKIARSQKTLIILVKYEPVFILCARHLRGPSGVL
jgi:molybdenum cofactor biosynthesis protein B